MAVYAWTRRRLGNKGGVLAATVYTYLPWHLATVYVRGAHAEAWLWACWPMTLWAVDRLGEQDLAGAWPALVAGLLALGAALGCQAGLTILFLPVLIAYAVVVMARHRSAARHFAVSSFVVLFSVGYLAQAGPGQPGSGAGQMLYPFQLLSPAGGEGPSFQLGLAALGLSLVSAALWLAGSLNRPPGSLDRPPGSLDRPPGSLDRPPGSLDRPPGSPNWPPP